MIKEVAGSVSIINNLKSRDLPKRGRGLSVAIGLSEFGEVFHSFLKYPHMVVAGTTGYGKTNFIKCLIAQLQGEIVLIDLKGGFDYDKVSATDIYEAEKELSKVVFKMKKRRKEHIFVIVDEAGELLPPSYADKKGKEPYLKCLEYCSEVARLGRGFHVHLIYATQYPTSEVLPRQIKQCAETRICFRLPTEIASRVAIDEEGAEQLPTGSYGRGIYKTDRKVELQTYLYTKREGDSDYVKETQGEDRDDTIVFE